MWDVELFLSLRVDEGAWLFGLLVEPAGDVGACCLDDGLYFCEVPALLHEVGEVVDIVEEGHPDVVGRVVALQLRQDVVPSLVVGLGHQFLYLVCCTLFRHLIIANHKQCRLDAGISSSRDGFGPIAPLLAIKASFA